MDAIVTAGGIPQPQDPLYTYSHGDSKALIDMAGKPMLQWVLDALGDAKQVDNVIVIGLSPKSGVMCKKPLYYVSNQGRMLANIVAGVNKSLELNRRNKYVLIVSSDIPTLKPEMVDWLVDTCMETKDDLYYGVCPKDVMEARFPDSKRTYTHLKDMDVCGADVNVTHVRMATEHLDVWESLIGSRKSPLQQASIIGFGTLFSLFIRRLTLEDAVARVCKRIGIKGRAIIWPYAEPCMDVDKPHQLELLRTDLAKQQRKTVAKARNAVKKTTKKSTRTKPLAKPVKKGAGAAKKVAAFDAPQTRLETREMKLNSILEFDARLSNQMRVAEKPGALRAIAVFFAHSGDSWFWAIALFAVWISGDSSWKEWAVVEFAGISLLAVLVLAIKFRVRRRRPEGEWGRIYRSTDPHSFPSGHAARSFLIAVIATALAPSWLAIALWVWAPLVALARVAMGVHYVSDVIAGAALGILMAWIGLQTYPLLFNWIFGLLGFTLW